MDILYFVRLCTIQSTAPSLHNFVQFHLMYFIFTAWFYELNLQLPCHKIFSYCNLSVCIFIDTPSSLYSLHTDRVVT